MKTLVLTALIAFSASNALASGKAYQFIFDKRMSIETCMAKAENVAAVYDLTARPTPGSTSEMQLINADGDVAGTAYHTDGTCHIYVY